MSNDLLVRAIDLLCGASSGFVVGSDRDVEWQNRKDRLLRDHGSKRQLTMADALRLIVDSAICSGRDNIIIDDIEAAIRKIME